MMDKLFFFIAMIASFYITINSIQSFSINFESLDYSIDDFKIGFIEDMQPFTNVNSTGNSTCPEGYDTLIKNFDWPGSFKGCGCKTEDGTGQFKYFVGYCPKTSQVCYNLDETFYNRLNKWKGTQICYKRSSKSYSELTVLPNDIDNINSCTNSTHQICGIIDGKNNLLCMNKNESSNSQE